jgi:hypothetical protein
MTLHILRISILKTNLKNGATVEVEDFNRIPNGMKAFTLQEQ